MIDSLLYWSAVACIGAIIDVILCWIFFPDDPIEEYRG